MCNAARHGRAALSAFPIFPRMSRKPKKGYFVKGQFVAEGSELDLELRAEQTGGEPSRTELKKESTEQKLGEALLRGTCSSGWICRNRCKPRWRTQAHHNFEGRRRQCSTWAS